MGGTALGHTTRRISPTELKQISAVMFSSFPEFAPRLVQSYRNKPDHGDIDIVVVGLADEVEAAVDARIRPTAKYINSHYVSFEYDGVQVDFICVNTPEEQQTQLDYMAWNDIGNFIGRVARSVGLKYGHDGLKYVLRLSDHYTREIVISTDTKKIYTFLGYDADVWAAGFDTKEDIFAFVATSDRFNPLYFSLEEQSHQDRVRNRKRKMYQGMLEYIATTGLPAKPKLTPDQRDDVLRQAVAYFNSDVLEQIRDGVSQYAASVAAAQRFNGDLVREWIGISGKELGVILGDFRNKHLDFKAYLLDTSSDEIKTDFLKWYNERNITT